MDTAKGRRPVRLTASAADQPTMVLGLADFGRPTGADSPGLYGLYGQPDGFGLVPAGIRVRMSLEGDPELGLSIIGSLGGDSYGVLQIAFDIDYPVDDALAAARALRPGAVVESLSWAAASLWLELNSPEGSWVKAFELAPSGPGTGRLVSRLDLADAEMLAAFLTGPASALGAIGAQGVGMVTGMALRTEATVAFDPAAVLADLILHFGAGGPVLVSDLQAQIRADPTWIPADRPVPDGQLDRFAAALADRLCTRFTGWFPFEPGPPRGACRLVEAASVDHGTTTWDLSAAAVVRRPFRLDFDRAGFAAMAGGLADRDRLVARMQSIGADLGLRRLHVYSRLSRPRAGALAMGVRVRAPARLPARPFDVVHTSDLSATDEAELTMDIGSPAQAPEAADLLISGYAVLEANDGAHDLVGRERPAPGEWIVVGPEDFPVSIAVLSASPAVLALGPVVGRVTRPGYDSVEVRLDPATPVMTVVAPPADADRPGPTLAVELLASDGSGSIAFPPRPLADLQLDLASLASFGRQVVEVTVIFGPDDQLALVELVPDGTPSEGSTPEPVALRFTAAEPTRTWAYLSPSPFRAGYRYRLRPMPGQPEAAWSPPRPAGRALVIASTGAEVVEAMQEGGR